MRAGETIDLEFDLRAFCLDDCIYGGLKRLQDEMLTIRVEVAEKTDRRYWYNIKVKKRHQ